MENLSIALIVKNEEEVLGRCLDSIKDLAGEIIIVDTGSTDKTVEIARQYTDKVYHFDWIDDFSAARNYSFDQCTKDWILWLDADDVVKEEDKAKIRALDLEKEEIIICAYEYSHDAFGNSECTVPRERVVKRSLNLRWEGEIHEYLPLRGKNRYARDISIHHYRNKGSGDRNLKLLERLVRGDSTELGYVKPGASPRNIYYLGKEYYEFNRIDEAMPYLTWFVEKTRDGFWEDYYQAWYKLACCYFQKNDEFNLKRCIFESLKIEERRAEAYCAMGLWYMSRDWGKAIHWYEMARNTKRPESLLASYQPEYYTFLPYLQLSVAYSAVGNIERALECSREVLKYRPQDSRALSNEAMLKDQLKKSYKDGGGKKLNIGCGNKPLTGYVNVDLFKGPIVDEVFEMDEIPYLDGTISAIHSEHALEHVGFDRAERTLKEWARVLNPGGELILKIPDFEECCRSYLNAPLEDPRFMSTKCWYKFTVYGIQKGQAGEPDEAQYHMSGFSSEEIGIVLKRHGYVVDSITKYDGWGTPSLECRAHKPDLAFNGTRVGWVAPENWEAAQTRIRVLNVNKWLNGHGYKSKVSMNIDDFNDCDIVIVGKEFSEGAFNQVKELKRRGKTVFCDVCESLWEFPWFKEVLEACDKVICCSSELERQVKKINPNTTVIGDAYE